MEIIEEVPVISSCWDDKEFVKKYQRQYKRRQGVKRHANIIDEIGKKWKDLTDEEKKEFGDIDKAEVIQIKCDFNDDMQQYRNKPVKITCHICKCNYNQNNEEKHIKSVKHTNNLLKSNDAKK